MTDHSLILKFTSLGEVAIDIPNGYDQINKYNGTMAHKFNHKFYEHNIRQSYGPITRFELHKKEPTKLELQKNELTKLELHKLEPIQKRTLLQIWSQNIYFRTLF